MFIRDDRSKVSKLQNIDAVSMKELEQSLETSSLTQEESEQLGAELPDLPYQDEPVMLGYDNEPVVERQPSGRWGIFFVVTLTIAASQLFDEFNQFVTQLFWLIPQALV